ncbi:MAG TPA: hypothetical protein VLJ44_07155, partial [Gaiellaceae bacterium]|nr:hypothetical protein [Gaiellaceae bacterium]
AAAPTPNQGTFSVSWAPSTDDPGQSLKYDLQRATASGGPFTTIAANLGTTSASEASLAQGTYWYRVVAHDATLAATSTISDSVIVDITPPTVQITSGCPTAKVDPGTTVTVHYSASDTGGSGLVDAPTGTVSRLVTTPGPASVDVVVHDHSGNTGTASCQFRVNGPPTTPGKPVASSSPNPGAFTLTWAASTDPDGDPVKYVLQHKPATSGSFTTVASNLASATYTFTSGAPESAGTWVYQVIAKDATLSSSPSPQSNQVIVQATPVISWTPASLLFGTPLGAAQLNATASFNGSNVPGGFVYTPASGAVVQPGQTLSVTFTPTDTVHFASATKTVPLTVTFSQACLTTSLSGSVIVKNNQAYCIQTGGKVSGSITVQSGGALYVSGGSVTGSITATVARALTICNASLGGSLTATSASGPVTVGAASGCAKNTISGSVTLTSNAKGVTLVGNTISGSVTLSSNAGGLAVSGNTVSGSVTVSSNAGGTVVSGNKVSQSMTITGNKGGITVTVNKITKSLTVTNNKGGYTISGNVVGGSTTISGNS